MKNMPTPPNNEGVLQKPKPQEQIPVRIKISEQVFKPTIFESASERRPAGGKEIYAKLSFVADGKNDDLYFGDAIVNVLAQAGIGDDQYEIDSHPNGVYSVAFPSGLANRSLQSIESILTPAAIFTETMRLQEVDREFQTSQGEHKRFIEQASKDYRAEKIRLLQALYEYGKAKTRPDLPVTNIPFYRYETRIPEPLPASSRAGREEKGSGGAATMDEPVTAGHLRFYGEQNDLFTEGILEVVRAYAERLDAEVDMRSEWMTNGTQDMVQYDLSLARYSEMGPRRTDPSLMDFVRDIQPMILQRLVDQYLKSNATKNQLRLELRSMGVSV